MEGFLELLDDDEVDGVGVVAAGVDVDGDVGVMVFGRKVAAMFDAAEEGLSGGIDAGDFLIVYRTGELSGEPIFQARSVVVVVGEGDDGWKRFGKVVVAEPAELTFRKTLR